MVERVSMAIAEKIPNFSMIGIGFYDKQTAGIKFVKEKENFALIWSAQNSQG